MPRTSTLGRVVLRLVAGSLLAAGLAACIALLSGDFGDVELKVIATSTILALVSATVGSGLAVRPRRPLLGLATVGLSLLAFAMTTAGMWLEIDPEWFWRATGVAAIGALDGAHASFVLSRRRSDDTPGVVTATRVAVVASAISAAMGTWPLTGPVPDDADEEAYAQVLGVVLVVQLVATAVAPLLRRLAAGAEPPAGTPLEPSARLADEIAAAADRIESLAPQPQVIAECERLRRVARAVRSA
jgi:hypothetical protein